MKNKNKLEWKTEKRKLKELKPYEKNPRRLTEDQKGKLLDSLEKFNLVEIPAINTDGTIIAGHQRIELLKMLEKEEEIEVRIPNRKLTEAELKEYNIRSNANTGEWDFEKLNDFFDKEELINWGMDEEEFIIEDEIDLEEKYSQKIGEVIYEPKQTNHQISDLFQRETKFDAEIDALRNEKLKEMLKARTSYFGNFNYPNIADYYAYQATAEEKAIFEKLALVLLDKDQLIENGFSKIINDVMEEQNEEN